MKRTFALTLGTLLFSAGLAQAQTYSSYPRATPGDPQTMVRSWYERYLRREPGASAGMWAQELRHGSSPEDVLAGILASEEYFTSAGRTGKGYAHQLLRDLLGREPSLTEVSYWSNQLRFVSRKEAAYRLLLLHPINASGMRTPSLNYDPGFYPDPASPTFRDPAGPYFHSPYEFNYENRRGIRAFPLRARG